MSAPVSRRRACVQIVGVAGAAMLRATPVFGAVRPFCCFSIENGWTATGPGEYITREAQPQDPSGVPEVVDQVEGHLGIHADIRVLIAKDENNAFATVANGRKILVIDVGFLDKLNRVSGTQWAAISVISHEMGHHIAGFHNPSSHQRELNADYWSGQSLQRLGSSRTAATAAILTFGTEEDTDSHPNKYRRAEVILKGWDDAEARKIDYSFCDNLCK